MTLYAFVLTAKYASEYWVNVEYKITNNFNSLTARDIQSAIRKKCAESPTFCTLTAFSHFFVVQWIFQLSQW